MGTDSQTFDWIQTVNGVANLHRWPNNFTLHFVRANLEGAARHWFASREIVHCSDFEKQFHKTFVGVVMMGDRWKQMSSSTNAVTIKKEDMKVAVGGKVAAPPRAYCINCGSKTHLSPQCPKPKRERGACYECGSMANQRGSCLVFMRGNYDGKGYKSAGLMSIDVVLDQDSPDEYPVPYEVQCQFNVPVEESESCCVNVNAVVDTGSPISIIKSELVPTILYTTQTVSKNIFVVLTARDWIYSVYSKRT